MNPKQALIENKLHEGVRIKYLSEGIKHIAMITQSTINGYCLSNGAYITVNQIIEVIV